MRLERLQTGQRLPERLFLRLVEAGTRRPPPDILYVWTYRPEIFGAAAGEFADDVLRGTSTWTRAEREVFAVFVSALNRCPFCVQAHSGVASRYEHDLALAHASAAEWDADVFSPRQRAALAFLQTLTTAPDSIGPSDAEDLRRDHIDADAAADLVFVCTLFATVNRIANALDFDPLTAVGSHWVSYVGYSLPLPLELLATRRRKQHLRDAPADAGASRQRPFFPRVPDKDA